MTAISRPLTTLALWGQMTHYRGMPLSLWIIVSVAIASAIFAVFIAWASNRNSQQNLKEQLERAWQQNVRQLKHEADQRSKQRAHDTEQLATQLKHAADDAAREREAVLRQSVYMEAAEALLSLHTLVGQMGATDCDENAVWEILAAKSAQIVRVHLIATDSTVEAVMVYLNEIAPGLLELAMLRRKLREPTSAHRGARKLPSEHERDHALRHLLSGEDASLPPPSSDAGLLDDTAEEELLVRHDKRTELCRHAVRLTHQSGKLLATSLLALRKEMGGPLDQQRYEQLWQVLVGKMEFVLKQEMESTGSLGSGVHAAQATGGD
jgi:hypothetical protein